MTSLVILLLLGLPVVGLAAYSAGRDRGISEGRREVYLEQAQETVERIQRRLG